MLDRIWGVAVSVSDLALSRDFYEKTLGMRRKYEYSSYIGFDCGGVELGLIPKNRVRLGENAPEIEFLTDDVDVVYRDLKEKGVVFTVEPHDEPWGGRQATFKDPDGNVLKITQINWRKYFSVASEGR